MSKIPQGRSGISGTTKDTFILDAGEVFVNIDLTALEDGSASDPVGDAIASAVSLGATRGGNSWSPGRTLREIPADGKLGPVKGFKRRQSIEPTLTVNLLEMTVANLEYALTGASAATAGSFQKITGGEVADANYVDNVAIITTYTGETTEVILGVQNALVVDSPEFATNDENEVVMAVTFVGHFSGATSTTEPWFVHHPTSGA